MAGPALSQLHAHRAIHDGGLSGAIEKTSHFVELWQQQQEDTKLALEHLLDYWETRIISHADAEESGFYDEKVQQNPSLQEAVTQLKRDHDLLRIIVKDIKETMNDEINEQTIEKLHALLVVNEIHSREEERMLFETT